MTKPPGGWAEPTIGEVAEVKLGKMLDKLKNRGEPTPYLRNVNVRWNAFDLDNIAQMRMSAEERLTLSIRDGDILVCEGGEPGRAAVWDQGSTNIAFQKALMRVRLLGGIEPRLLVNFLRNSQASGSLERHFTGTTIKHLPQAALSEIPLRLPPLPEQRRIVAKIDSLIGKSKRASEHLDHIPRLVDKYKQVILATAFEQAEDHAETIVTLGDIAIEVRNGLSKKPADQPPGTPILRISAVRPLRVQLQDRRYYPISESIPHGAHLRNGDLLFTRYNGNPELTAVCGMVRGLGDRLIYPDKLIRVRLSGRAKPEFVELLCASPQVRERLRPHIKTAAGQHGISGSDLKKLPIPLPSTSFQTEWVRRIEAALTWVARLASEAVCARRLVDHLDQAVLAKAFRGELVPQDPSDEPASELLERIRAERTKTTRKRRQRRGVTREPA